MAAATVQFLTEHMPHDTPVALRYKELHRAWVCVRIVDDGCVAHRCQGCHTPIRHRFILASKIGLAETYVGSTCILVFEKEAPDFVEACRPMLDECAARKRLLSRKVPLWIRELPGMPLTNYRSVRRAIDNKTKRYMCEGYSHELTAFVKFATKQLSDEDQVLFGA